MFSRHHPSRPDRFPECGHSVQVEAPAEIAELLNNILEKNPKEISISNIIYAVDEQVKTLNCKRESKRGCNGKTVKCITHNLWDDLEKHINDFFQKVSLNDLIKQKNMDMHK